MVGWGGWEWLIEFSELCHKMAKINDKFKPIGLKLERIKILRTPPKAPINKLEVWIVTQKSDGFSGWPSADSLTPKFGFLIKF